MNNTLDFTSINFGEMLKDEEMFNNFIYTPLPEAIAELKLRCKQKDIEEKVNEYLLGDVPEPLKHHFKAVLFRPIITPNQEFARFYDLIQKSGIKPMFLEYLNDKFTSVNPLKYSLGKLRCYIDVSKHKKARVESEKVIEFNICEGKKINIVKTTNGQFLADFHHALLESVFPQSSRYLYDGSEWFHRAGDKAKKYYTRYMSLFVRHAILFENYLLEGGEFKFVRDTFFPTFLEVWESTGKKPLIVNLLPFETQKDDFWSSYKIEIMSEIGSGKIKQKMVK